MKINVNHITYVLTTVTELFFQGETPEHLNQTPETANSTTLKRRGRRTSSAIPFTEESNVPTKNPKNIKIEKVIIFS